MIRFMDIVFSLFGLFLTLPFLILVSLVGFIDTGAPIFIQKRVGRDKEAFYLIKFRTMKLSTKSVASHLADSNNITRFGKILRKTKLDELPQLINVLKGDMSLVGPRPNLFNQDALIKARDTLNVYNVSPGITGLAQINNIDMSTPELLAKTDRMMLDSLSVRSYFKLLVLTMRGAGSGDAIK